MKKDRNNAEKTRAAPAAREVGLKAAGSILFTPCRSPRAGPAPVSISEILFTIPPSVWCDMEVSFDGPIIQQPAAGGKFFLPDGGGRIPYLFYKYSNCG